MKTTKPKTINEAIEELCVFLECDLYTKFRPEHKIKGEKHYREDVFENEEQMVDYLRECFGTLKKQIKDLEDKDERKKI